MSLLKNIANEFILISQKNIGHYDQNAISYDEGTKGHDVSQNINAFLRAIKAEPPFHLLDFGCGPGRDLQTLTKLGHVAIGLEGRPKAAFDFRSSQVKYINTDKHILRFAKNNRTAARKAFCLIVICVSCSSGF